MVFNYCQHSCGERVAVVSDHPLFLLIVHLLTAFSSVKGHKENCLETLIFYFFLALSCGEKKSI